MRISDPIHAHDLIRDENGEITCLNLSCPLRVPKPEGSADLSTAYRVWV